tara:strand:- start:1189 stop:1368 length:180 start_codon:yes stop_codon:yes gene_type:complete
MLLFVQFQPNIKQFYHFLPLYTTLLINFTTSTPAQENQMKKKLNTNHTSELYIFEIIYN